MVYRCWIIDWRKMNKSNFSKSNFYKTMKEIEKIDAKIKELEEKKEALNKTKVEQLNSYVDDMLSFSKLNFNEFISELKKYKKVDKKKSTVDNKPIVEISSFDNDLGFEEDVESTEYITKNNMYNEYE